MLSLARVKIIVLLALLALVALSLGPDAAKAESDTLNLLHATVDGDTLTLTYDQELHPTGWTLGVDAFTLQVNGEVADLTDPDMPSHMKWCCTTVSDSRVFIPLQNPVSVDDVVRLSYTSSFWNTIHTYHPYRYAANFSNLLVTNVTTVDTSPTLSSVAVTSDAGDDDTYGLGETIRVTLTFSEAVDVTGAPRLKIKMDPTWGEFWANYESGSGATALTFAYTVAEPNTSPRGIAALANTLELNGGTVRSASSGDHAKLAHTGLNHDPNHKVDWRVPPPEATATPEPVPATPEPTPEPVPATPEPTPEPTPEDEYEPDQQLIDTVWIYAAETNNGFDHVLRWMRALKTFGAIEDMTAAEAQDMADRYWAVRWDPVVAELTELEASTSDS